MSVVSGPFITFLFSLSFKKCDVKDCVSVTHSYGLLMLFLWLLVGQYKLQKEKSEGIICEICLVFVIERKGAEMNSEENRLDCVAML